MTDDQPLGGLVVAGGYSRRFGDRDKALADLAGSPLIRRVVGRLQRVAEPVVLNCRDEQVAAIRDALPADVTVRFATDPVPDRGPVAGVRTGLEALECEYVAVVACDVPFVDPDLLLDLAERARGHEGAVVYLEGGRFQPLQAVYQTDAMATACEATLESGDDSLVSVLERMDVVTVEEAALEDVDGATFDSIDTQAALSAAERRLEESQ